MFPPEVAFPQPETWAEELGYEEKTWSHTVAPLFQEESAEVVGGSDASLCKFSRAHPTEKTF